MSTWTRSARLDAKDPSDVKDYAIDWADILAAEDETTIASSEWAVSPAGLTILTTAPHGAYVLGTRTVVWVSGGTANVDYRLTNTITTGSATPRTHERSITVPCRSL